MRVLADYHHHDLWESLELLCERLGWTLFRPIGMDWFTEGYWNHERKWHGDAIARQYLEPWGSDVLPEYFGDGKWSLTSGVRIDLSHDRALNLIGLEQARDEPPDIVISSLAHNHEGFARFASEVGATFGLQVGNVRFSPIDMQEDRWDLAAFGLVSGFMPAPIDKPHVVYHQEFTVRPYTAPPRLADDFRVSSFVQCYPQDQGAYPYWIEAAKRARELDWRVYGAYGEAPIDEYAAGNIGVCDEVGEAMNLSDIAWHAKRWSDGYGHVIHQWFAHGRPVFGFQRYYADQMAGPLWEDGVTSYDIGSRSPDEVVALIRRLREDEEAHTRMCEAARARFDAVVNFDEEADVIRQMFAQVLP